MENIGEREQNLFNATDTMAQFYDEIETFLGILFGNMEREGFSGTAERLRSGTMSVKNLTRRLLAAITVLYVEGNAKTEESVEEDEAEDEDKLDAGEEAREDEVILSKDVKIPFVCVWLFRPSTIPTAHTLSSPLLLTGAIGDFAFIDKKSKERVELSEPKLSMSNLVQVRFAPNSKSGDIQNLNFWRPKSMRKYKLEAKLVGFDSQKLLEIDSQAKIKTIAEKLVGYCG